MMDIITQPPTETQRYFSTLQAGIRTREVVMKNYRRDRLPVLRSTVARMIAPTLAHRCGGSDGLAGLRSWRTVFPFNPLTG